MKRIHSSPLRHESLAKDPNYIEVFTGLCPEAFGWYIDQAVEAVSFFASSPRLAGFLSPSSPSIQLEKDSSNNYSPQDAQKKRGRPRALKPHDAVTATLIKLRQDYSYFVLGYLFGVPESTMQDTVADVMKVISGKLTDRLFYLYPKDLAMTHVPTDWEEKFPGTIFIGDGAPLPVLAPQNFLAQKLTYSSYKHANVVHMVFCQYPISCYPRYLSLFLLSHFALWVDNAEVRSLWWTVRGDHNYTQRKQHRGVPRR